MISQDKTQNNLQFPGPVLEQRPHLDREPLLLEPLERPEAVVAQRQVVLRVRPGLVQLKVVFQWCTVRLNDF